jgi:hypothetical protein
MILLHLLNECVDNKESIEHGELLRKCFTEQKGHVIHLYDLKLEAVQ